MAESGTWHATQHPAGDDRRSSSGYPGRSRAREIADEPGPSYGLDAMAEFERLPFTKVRQRIGHESSFDRTGGNDDFGNVLYVQPGKEKVLLDVKGPGCVYRMWFTAYTPSATLRVYFDEEPSPRIELPMGEPGDGTGLFSGEVPPFLPPLVANSQVASGGAYSYVPLPFQRAIRVTTTDPSRHFYYNIDYNLFEPDSVVRTWTGREDSSHVRAMWSSVGDDPKSQIGVTTASGTATVPTGGYSDLLDLTGPRQISAVALTIPGLVAGQATSEPVTDRGRAHTGASQFTMAIDPANEGVVLTRRLDFGIADQKASVYVDGTFAGTWSTPGAAAADRWRDSSFSLPASSTSGKTSITVRIVFERSTVDWNEFGYWVASTVDGSDRQTDVLDVGNPADESAHSYVIRKQTWTGTRSFTYPADPSPVDDGRAHQGSSRFTIAVDPANQGVTLRRRLDYGVPDQKATVYVDGEPVGEWVTPGSDSTYAWRNHGFAIPARFSSGKSSLAVRLVTAGPDATWTECRYWVYSTVNATRLLTDEVNIGDTASESAHEYAITGQTGTFTRHHSYPPAQHHQDVLNNVWLQAAWDDESNPSVNAPLGSLFGMGQFGVAESRGLGAGIRDDGSMYLYFPMPFAHRARVRVVNESEAPVDLGYEISHKPFTDPFTGVGYFTTAFHSELPTTPGKDILLLDTTGAGQVVGVVQSVQGAPSRWYLEGDERAMIDGSRSPAVHGTGTEDFYNGAFYFENGPYTQPISGNTVHIRDGRSDSTAVYRQLISDAIPFRSHLRLTIEHGGTNDTTENVWTLVHYYLEPAAKLHLSDTVLVGDKDSEAQHDYAISRQTWSGSRTFTFEGENDHAKVSATGRAHKGTSEFTLTISPDNRGVTLRRMFDQGVHSQHASVRVDGVTVGTWFVAGGNSRHRWREEDFAIPARYTSGKRTVRVGIEFVASTRDWNEFRYQALSLLP
jgi:hypothetical protein